MLPTHPVAALRYRAPRIERVDAARVLATLAREALHALALLVALVAAPCTGGALAIAIGAALAGQLDVSAWSVVMAAAGVSLCWPALHLDARRRRPPGTEATVDAEERRDAPAL